MATPVQHRPRLAEEWAVRLIAAAKAYMRAHLTWNRQSAYVELSPQADQPFALYKEPITEIVEEIRREERQRLLALLRDGKDIEAELVKE